MIYRGKEKENHRGSHVRYYHCGKWHEGTLLEPVNYQIVVTKENPPAVLSCTEGSIPSEEDLSKAIEHVHRREYDENDLAVLSAYVGVRFKSEVESVEITEANDISQEEADKIIEELKEKYFPK